MWYTIYARHVFDSNRINTEGHQVNFSGILNAKSASVEEAYSLCAKKIES